MLEFTPGPHGERISPTQQKIIEEAFISCMDASSKYHKVNVAYNNIHHFMFSQYDYDIQTFLSEIKNVVDSSFNKIQVMGDVHTDPYGHTSGLIGQYTEYQEFAPAIVKDSYVRFKLQFDPKHVKAYKVLDPSKIYHFLIDVPSIVQLQMHHTIPVYIYPLYDLKGKRIVNPQSLYPSTRYKNIKIIQSA